MDLVFTDRSDVLEALITEFGDSPEALLLALEDALETGQLTLSEVACYLADCSAASR
jgi:hypothetical protein